NEVFTEFDQICFEYHLEKIQTIGDAYIAALLDSEIKLDDVSQTPQGNPATFTAAFRTCVAAIKMQRAMSVFHISGLFCTLPTGNMQVRIGVHSGTALGAMTGGQSKIKYELIGEAVDEAEMVQSLGEPGKRKPSYEDMTDKPTDVGVPEVERGDMVDPLKGLETWETPRLMDKRTMKFPRHLEAIYTREQYRSSASRVLGFCLALIVVVQAVVFLSFDLTSLRIAGETGWWVVTIMGYAIILLSGLLAFVLLWGYSVKRSNRGDDIRLTWATAVLIVTVCIFALQSENFLHWPSFHQTPTIPISVYIVCLTGTVGVLIRFHTFRMLILFMITVTTLRGIILISSGGTQSTLLSQLITLTTSYVLSYYCAGRGLAFESTMRFRYIKSKVVEIKLDRVERQKVLVKRILSVMLPESVIPRLAASDFQFSTVTDRVPNAI
ncbi:hypothetical protein HDV05_000454, partial [Chytridiales sp. JEL 0842]